MVSFDNVPNELVLDVVSHVKDAEDLVSFAMSCRRIQVMAEPILQRRHRAFRLGEQRTFDDQPQVGEDPPLPNTPGDVAAEVHQDQHTNRLATCARSDTWAYLLSICRHRKLSLYPRFAGINVCGYADSWSTLIDSKPWSISKKDQIQIVKAMGSLNMKKRARELYMEELKSGNTWTYIKLILLLLSNLQDLAIKHDGHEKMDLEIAPWIPRGNFFHKLKNVWMDGSATDEKGFLVMWPLLFQPSVEKIIARGINRFTSKAPGLPYWPHPSNLKCLIIHEGLIAAKQLERFFRHTPNLNSFSYSHTCLDEDRFGNCVSLGELNKALSILESSLTSLQLEVSPSQVLSVFPVPQGRALKPSDLQPLDFSGFDVLQMMWLPWYLIIPFHDDAPEEGESLLRATLPDSLVKLDIHLGPVDMPSETAPVHIKDLLRGSDDGDCCPNLGQVVIFKRPAEGEDRKTPEEWKPVIKLGQRAGVQVKMNYFEFPLDSDDDTVDEDDDEDDMSEDEDGMYEAGNFVAEDEDDSDEENI